MDLQFWCEVGLHELWEKEMIEQRLMDRVIKSSGCWLWTGGVDALGYGRMNVLGEHRVHRISWRLFRGSPGALKVLHKCDVRNCVNPDHLFLGTQADNVADMMSKKRHRCIPLHGEANPMAKLTAEKVNRMQDVRESTGRSYRLIGRDFGVSAMTAYRAITGQSWSK